MLWRPSSSDAWQQSFSHMGNPALNHQLPDDHPLQLFRRGFATTAELSAALKAASNETRLAINRPNLWRLWFTYDDCRPAPDIIVLTTHVQYRINDDEL